MITPDAENQRRLKLYEKGYCDRKIAESSGVSENAIRLWRRARGLKCNSEPIVSVPMEKALNPSQCQAMKRFLGCLATYSDRYPGRKIDILIFAKEYREGVGAVG